MRSIVTLNQLMVFYLQTLTDTELKWSEALGRVVDKVQSEDLKELIKRSIELSRNHLRILAEILEKAGEQGTFAKGMVVYGVINEMQEMLQMAADPEVRDAGLIVVHQSINHYKIAQYGAVCSYARLLGREDVAGTLHHILEEEKGADEALTLLAEAKINPKARSPLVM